jgi:hypothetical protein
MFVSTQDELRNFWATVFGTLRIIPSPPFRGLKGRNKPFSSEYYQPAAQSFYLKSLNNTTSLVAVWRM